MKQLIYNNKIMSTALVILFVLLIRSIYPTSEPARNKSFISIEIKQGDTLYTIATQYAADVQRTDYIQEITEINNLKNDTIHEGCYLLIPIYQ